MRAAVDEGTKPAGEPVHGEDVADAKPHRTARVESMLSGEGFDAPDGVENGDGESLNVATGRGEAHPPADSLQQGYSESALQAVDLLAHRGL